MFIPKQKCSIRKIQGRDRYGQESLGSPASAPCSVVKLGNLVEKTSVRADSSASRGAAKEEQAYAVLLIHKKASVDNGDVISINGTEIQVTNVMPRFNVQGAIDHYQIEAKAWQQK